MLRRGQRAGDLLDKIVPSRRSGRSPATYVARLACQATPKTSFQHAYDAPADQGSASSSPTPLVARPKSSSASVIAPKTTRAAAFLRNAATLCANDSRKPAPSNSAANGTNISGSDKAMPAVYAETTPSPVIDSSLPAGAR